MSGICRSLENDEDVLISGFGKLSVKEKHGRRGRNFRNGEPTILLRGRAVTFMCCGVMRAVTNVADSVLATKVVPGVWLLFAEPATRKRTYQVRVGFDVAAIE